MVKGDTDIRRRASMGELVLYTTMIIILATLSTYVYGSEVFSFSIIEKTMYGSTSTLANVIPLLHETADPSVLGM